LAGVTGQQVMHTPHRHMILPLIYPEVLFCPIFGCAYPTGLVRSMTIRYLRNSMVQVSQFFNIQQQKNMRMRDPMQITSTKFKKVSELPDSHVYQYSIGAFSNKIILSKIILRHLHFYLHIQCTLHLAYEYQ
jgi:hypothetical protein